MTLSFNCGNCDRLVAEGTVEHIYSIGVVTARKTITLGFCKFHCALQWIDTHRTMLIRRDLSFMDVAEGLDIIKEGFTSADKIA